MTILVTHKRGRNRDVLNPMITGMIVVGEPICATSLISVSVNARLVKSYFERRARLAEFVISEGEKLDLNSFK